MKSARFTTEAENYGCIVLDDDREVWGPIPPDSSFAGLREEFEAWNGTVTPYEATAEPSRCYPISDRQFYQQLAVTGRITQAEALAAVQTGTIPAALDAYIDSLSTDDEKFNARMLLSGAISFERMHPLTEAIGIAQNLTEEQLDDFWTAAGLL